MLFNSAGATRNPRWDSLHQKEHVGFCFTQVTSLRSSTSAPICASGDAWSVYSNSNLVSEPEDEREIEREKRL